jgi:hypothetical protein
MYKGKEGKDSLQEQEQRPEKGGKGPAGKAAWKRFSRRPFSFSEATDPWRKRKMHAYQTLQKVTKDARRKGTSIDGPAPEEGIRRIRETLRTGKRGYPQAPSGTEGTVREERFVWIFLSERDERYENDP